MIRDDIILLIEKAIKKAQKKGDLPPFDLPEVTVDHPKDATRGDYASPVCMSMARLARMAPVQIAEKVLARMDRPDYVGAVEVAHPGFINISLAPAWVAAPGGDGAERKGALRQRQPGQGPARPGGVHQRQPDRPADLRLRAQRGLGRYTGQRAGRRRMAGAARILRQRHRQPDSHLRRQPVRPLRPGPGPRRAVARRRLPRRLPGRDRTGHCRRIRRPLLEDGPGCGAEGIAGRGPQAYAGDDRGRRRSVGHSLRPLEIGAKPIRRRHLWGGFQ